MTRPWRVPRTTDAGWMLILIVCLAALLRGWALDFGLPNTETRPDETVVIQTALRFFTGDLNPHFFNYPTCFMYVLFGLYAVWFGVSHLCGQTVDGFLYLVTAQPAVFYLLARLVSAAVGTASVWWVFRIGRELGGRLAGLAAAVFLAVCYLHVRDSHFGVTDVATTFLGLGAVAWMLDAVRVPSRRNVLLAGAAAGLATGTKYGAVCLLVPMTIMLVAAPAEPGESPSWWRQMLRRLTRAARNPETWLAVVAFAGAFVVSTPYAVLDHDAFVRDFLVESQHLRTGHHGLDLGIGWWYHLRFTLPYGVGWAMLIAALFGVWLACRHSALVAAVTFSFPVAYYLLAGSGRTVFVRYMVPVVPFVCIAAAVVVASAAQALSPRNRRAAGLAAALLAAVIMAEPLYASVRFLAILGQRDTRLLAADWIEQHVPPGRTVYGTGVYYTWPQLRPALGELRERYAETQAARKGGRIERIVLAHAEADPNWRGYRQLRALPPPAAESGFPDILVVSTSPLSRYRGVLPTEQTVLSARYRLVERIPASAGGDGAGWYDQSDAFFVPFRGFDGVRRPGPSIVIYERVR
jgi:hypothetical protein